jgi:nicotinate-nucleotide adenylyltransferase
MRIVILGGTFDPIHIGHLAIAEDVRFELQAERTIFVPAAQQPFKQRAAAATAADRLAMVERAIVDNPYFSVSDIEVRRGGISYSVDTVQALHDELPATELFLIVGADAAAGLPRWHEVERLLHLCCIAIVERPGYDLDREALFAALPAARDRVRFIRGPALTISASEVRQRLQNGYPVRYHLPGAVYRYIQQHGLYRSP